jgi:hypothetical protein
MRFRIYLVLVIFFGLLVTVSIASLQRCATSLVPAFLGSAAQPARDAAAPVASTGSLVVNTVTANERALGAAGGLQALAVAPVDAPGSFEGLQLRLSRPLMFDVPEVGGLAVAGQAYYVSAADATKRSAVIYQVSASLTVMQVRALQEGPFWRVGGIHAAQDLIWAPLCHEERTSSLILGIDARTLEIKRRFAIEAAIAAVAQGTDGNLIGIDYEGQWFYVWAHDGRELRRSPNGSGAVYGDMDVVRGSLVCAGVDAHGGVLDVLDPSSLSLLARHDSTIRTPRGEWLTKGGLASQGEEFLFLPEGGTYPMLHAFQLKGVSLADYIPSTRP